jgi:CDP-diacylglycerol---glycerol-3-phosphate 3-phosphatidyltransferase
MDGMSAVIDLQQASTHRRLKREWAFFVLLSAVFLTLSCVVLWWNWGEVYALRWLLLSASISAYALVYARNHLDDNRSNFEGSILFDNLGLANWITLVRAIFNAALAGFLLGPWPQGWLAWAPSLLYLFSSILDYADGFVARVSGRTTILGENLDMKWDGVGALIASLLTVLYGQTPLPFMLVGAARYLYLFGIWNRERQAFPVYSLPQNRFRRPFAGMLMGLLAVLLMPVYSPPATYVAAWLFMLPFLINFYRDWLFVSGSMGQGNARAENSSRSGWKSVLPVAVRILLVIFLLMLLITSFSQRPLAVGVILVAGLAIPALLAGAAGRLFALAVLLMTGFALQQNASQWQLWSILLLSEITLMIGTGRYSLWTPEDWLMYKQAGENQHSAKLPQ